MALGIGRGFDHIRVLSDLSGDVVGALLDEGDRRPSESDPFAAALRRYEKEGQPLDLTEPWRRTIAPSPVLATDRAATVLRLLARDLLACLAAPRTEAGAKDEQPEPEVLPTNVRPIGASAAAIPALELASDGTWRPSTSAGGPKEDLETGRRPAYVPTLGSRYPDISGTQGTHTLLPPPPPATTQIPAITPPPATTTVTPPPPPAAPRLAESATSVIQAVSGGVELLAGPFDRFQQLAAFVRALRALPGVQDATTRQFVRGTVHLRVRYADAIELSTRLAGMAEFAPEIVASSPTRIELRVRPPDDAPPPRG
jgi:hypothetical protein